MDRNTAHYETAAEGQGQNENKPFRIFYGTSFHRTRRGSLAPGKSSGRYSSNELRCHMAARGTYPRKRERIESK